MSKFILSIDTSILLNTKLHLMNYLNMVEATVTLAGTVIHFVDLELNQGFNKHHTCNILVNYEEIDKGGWMRNPVDILKKIGESLTIEFRHKQTGETNTFFGIINNITFLGRHGQQNNILFQGISETIKLDGKPSMDSFTDQILENIATEVVDNSGNGAKIISQPRYSRPIKYLSMWNETCFNFLNRLSSLYGEAFFSDNGSNIYFGLPMLSKSIPITYDVEIISMQLSASLRPARFSQYDYYVESDQDWGSETDLTRPSTHGYQKVIAEKSDILFNMENNSPSDVKVDMQGTMMEMMDLERSRDIAGMLLLKGTAHTCKIGVGKIINVVYPKGMKIDTTSGDFLITEVTHTINQEGIYSNTFSGVRAGLEQVPVCNVIQPTVSSQRAIVMDNADPQGMGRIRVQFQWQQKQGKTTNWIRVQTPDAGGDTGSGRGFIFIPETGDEVMVNFINSDPSRPYVSGSMFPKATARGGLEDNHLKSIITRSGHTVMFNDDDESLSITIKDKNGNIMHFDTVGKNITITAPETITMNAKNIVMNAGESITGHAGQDIHMNADNNIDLLAGEDCQTAANKIFTQAVTDSMHTAKKYETIADKTRIDSTQENLELASNKEVDVQSAKKVRLF